MIFLNRQPIKTVAFSILTGLLTLTFIELLLRLPFVETNLPWPDYGTNNTELGIKIARLDRLMNEWGTVDCIFMGSSVMDTSIDAAAFSEAYTRVTGNQGNCYNFALAGQPIISAPSVARFLIARYQPHTLIYGVGVIEFQEGFNAKDQYELPWIQYASGKFSLAGWFIENVHIGKHFSALRFYSDYEYRNNYYHFYNSVDESGLDAHPEIYNYQPSETIKFPDFKLSNAATAKLGEFLELAVATDTHVILIEEPVYRDDMDYAYIGGTEQYQQKFIKPLEQFLTSKDIDLLITQPESLAVVPANGWMNETHLNKYGAPFFSEWLGNQIGVLVRQGRLEDINR